MTTRDAYVGIPGRGRVNNLARVKFSETPSVQLVVVPLCPGGMVSNLNHQGVE
ncbi:MAG: hypothetical protein M1393_02775 [Candidatus Thermoplasmatota archaeon]|nr:hypothetical protein [Candidatus Thermoplasmatota archaeon]